MISGAELLELVKNDLREAIPRPKYEVLIRPLRLQEIGENRIVLLAETESLKHWLQEQYFQQIKETFQKYLTKPVELEIDIVQGSLFQEGEQVDLLELVEASAPVPSPPVKRTVLFNPRFTFENFVVGESNQFAYSACLAVSQRPGFAYNPLFIYSGVGLGKTHLMHSVGQKILEKHQDLNVLYVTTEKFTNDFITKVRNNQLPDFHKKYRSCNCLLIDDIQFLAGKTETQAEFFHTFNYLYENGRQIIISSDRAPRSLRSLDDRLVSRFAGGLITDIQEPSFETRLAILQKKAALEGMKVTDDVLVLIAENITSNIRDLEGALIKLVAYSNHLADSGPITLDMANKVLRDVLPDPQRPIVTNLRSIINVVCDYFKVDRNLIMSSNRSKNVALARQIIMYLAREYTSLSLSQIGLEVGNRDHATVLYSHRKICDDITEDPFLELTISNLTKLIR